MKLIKTDEVTYLKTKNKYKYTNLELAAAIFLAFVAGVAFNYDPIVGVIGAFAAFYIFWIWRIAF